MYGQVRESRIAGAEADRGLLQTARTGSWPDDGHVSTAHAGRVSAKLCGASVEIVGIAQMTGQIRD